MLTKILQSHGVRQLLGAGAGMLIAVAIYAVLQVLPSSQISKGLLIDPLSLLGQNADKVSVNDKTLEADQLARLASRARQITSSASSDVSAVATTGDRSAWIAMRQAARARASVHDLAPHAAAETPVDTTAVADTTSVSNAEVMVEQPVQVSSRETVATTSLPNSGLGLNILVLCSFLGAFLWMRTRHNASLQE